VIFCLKFECKLIYLTIEKFNNQSILSEFRHHNIITYIKIVRLYARFAKDYILQCY